MYTFLKLLQLLNTICFKGVVCKTCKVIISFNLIKNYVIKVFRESQLKGINTDELTTTQVFYESKDGTKVPMFVSHRKVCKIRLTKLQIIVFGKF